MPKPEPSSPGLAGRTTRRRFLGTVGAGALATSAVIFVSLESASAYTYGC